MSPQPSDCALLWIVTNAEPQESRHTVYVAQHLQINTAHSFPLPCTLCPRMHVAFPCHALLLPGVLPSPAWFLSAGHNAHRKSPPHHAAASGHRAAAPTVPQSKHIIRFSLHSDKMELEGSPRSCSAHRALGTVEQHHMGAAEQQLWSSQCQKHKLRMEQCSAAHNKTARAEPSKEEAKPWYLQQFCQDYLARLRLKSASSVPKQALILHPQLLHSPFPLHSTVLGSYSP